MTAFVAMPGEAKHHQHHLVDEERRAAEPLARVAWQNRLASDWLNCIVSGAPCCKTDSEALTRTNAVVNGSNIASMDVDPAMGSNGVATDTAVRQRRNIPSLLVSWNLDEATRALALEWSPIGFVGEPYSERKVLAAISSACIAPP